MDASLSPNSKPAETNPPHISASQEIAYSELYIAAIAIIRWRITAREHYKDLEEPPIDFSKTSLSPAERDHVYQLVPDLLDRTNVEATDWSARESIQDTYRVASSILESTILLVREEYENKCKEFESAIIERGCPRLSAAALKELHERLFPFYSAQVSNFLGIRELSKELDGKLVQNLIDFNNRSIELYGTTSGHPIGHSPNQSEQFSDSLDKDIKAHISDGKICEAFCHTLNILPALAISPCTKTHFSKSNHVFNALVASQLAKLALADLNQSYPGIRDLERIFNTSVLPHESRLIKSLSGMAANRSEEYSKILDPEVIQRLSISDALILRAYLATSAFASTFSPADYAQEFVMLDNLIQTALFGSSAGYRFNLPLSELDSGSQGATGSGLSMMEAVMEGLPEDLIGLRALMDSKSYRAIGTIYINYPELLRALLEAYGKPRALFSKHHLEEHSDIMWFREVMRPVLEPKWEQSDAIAKTAMPTPSTYLLQDPLQWSLEACFKSRRYPDIMVPVISELIEQSIMTHGSIPESFTRTLFDWIINEYNGSVWRRMITPPLGAICEISSPSKANFQEFHRLFNSAAQAEHSQREYLATPEFWVLLIAYPGYTNQAQSLIAQALSHSPVSDFEPKTRYRAINELVQSVLLLVEESSNQQKTLGEAEFMRGPSSYRTDGMGEVLTANDFIDGLSHDAARVDRKSPYLWLAQETTGLHVWSSTLKYVLLSRGYTLEEFHSIYEQVHSRTYPPTMDHFSGRLFVKWSYFNKAEPLILPNAMVPRDRDISEALTTLLPSRAGNYRSGDWGTYEVFSELMQNIPKSVFSRIHLSGLAILTKLTEQRALSQGQTTVLDLAERRTRSLSVKEFALHTLEFDHNAYEDNRLISLLAHHTEASLDRLVDEMLAKLVTIPETFPNWKPLDTLVLIQALRIKDTDFPGKRPLGAAIHSFNEAHAQGRIAPLPKEWHAKQFNHTLRHIKPIEESHIIGATETHIRDISNKIERIYSYIQSLQKHQDASSTLTAFDEARSVSELSDGPLRSAETELLLNTPSGRFLQELLTHTRYRDQLINYDLSSNPRGRLLRIMEALTEGLNGGAFDEIKCVRSEEERELIAEDIQIHELNAALVAEYSIYRDSASHPTRTSVLHFLPTRGILMELGGHWCQTCLSRTDGIGERYPNAVFFPFVQERIDRQGKSKFRPAGGTFLLEIDGVDGEKLLIVRGFNPSQALLKEIKSNELFELFIEDISIVAKERGISRIIVPADDWWGNSLTNRPFVFLHVEDTYYRESNRLDLPKELAVEFNDILMNTFYVVRDL